MAVLTDIFAIKAFRSEKAEKSLLKQRGVLTQARDRQRALEHMLKTFREQSRAQERSLYQGLCTSVVRVRDIDEIRERVSELKQRELHYESRLSEAKEQVLREAKALEECRIMQRKASAELDGMRTVLEEMDAVASYEAEYREETEREDRLMPPGAGRTVAEQEAAL